MAAAADRNNQRRWKNYLLNKRYQLRFTLFMAGLSAVLMGLLGWWVHTQAQRATRIAEINVTGGEGVRCDDPGMGDYYVSPPMPGGDDEAGADEDLALGGFADDDLGVDLGEDEAGLGDWDDEDGEPLDWEDDEGAGESRDAPAVELGEVTEQIDQDQRDGRGAAGGPTPAEAQRFFECRMEQATELAALMAPIYRGERTITVAMIAVGIVLVIGIALYGIVMTHRVAGPLYKISLYLNKLKEGRYGPVYNLRKGDHLVEFYEHFKRAHEGLRSMQEEDLARLREAVEAADREGLAERSPELAEAIEAMRALAKEKEESLG